MHSLEKHGVSQSELGKLVTAHSLQAGNTDFHSGLDKLL